MTVSFRSTPKVMTQEKIFGKYLIEYELKMMERQTLESSRDLFEL